MTGGDSCLRRGGPPISEAHVSPGLSFWCPGWSQGIRELRRRSNASRWRSGKVLETIQGDSFSLQDAISHRRRSGCDSRYPVRRSPSWRWMEKTRDGSRSEGSHGSGKTDDHQRCCATMRARAGVGEGKSAAVVTSPRGGLLGVQVEWRAACRQPGPDHRLRSQHDAQLLLSAGKHGLISAQACPGDPDDR